MHCPNCQGDLTTISLKAAGGITLKAKRCSQCGGFWFERGHYDDVLPSFANKIDPANPNYSLQEYNFSCPNDETIMTEHNGDFDEPGVRFWTCPECQGSFIPRGQLSLITNLKAQEAQETASAIGGSKRAKLAETFLLLGVGTFFIISAVRTDAALFASPTDPLPVTSPNTLALALLGLTYLAGTILAVLGRKTPIIFMGWSVVAICLFGFSVIIFGP